MTRKFLSVAAPLIAIAVLLCTTAAAQVPQRQPGPELAKLQAFVGKWTTKAHTNQSPMGPAGDFTATDSMDWQPGKFFLINNSTFNSTVFGSGTELMVMGYDTNRRVYTYESFNSAGEHETATGTVSGDTWTWSSGPESQFKWHYVEKFTSPNAMNIRFEMSSDGTTWTPLMEGTSTK